MGQNCFVTKIDISLAEKLKKDLLEQGFSLKEAPYAFFAAKKTGVSCTLYTSGKLMVQGKAMQEFIEFYLEPHILQSFEFSYAETNIDTTPHIGVDESGKGDLFGPLCIAAVYGEGKQILELQALGIKDSKNIKDVTIKTLAQKIKKTLPHTVVRINPKRYNELYSQFNNLNKMLAWGHATVIENLSKETGCQRAIIDQFAHERVVSTALERKKLHIDLFQRHRGEEDLVVAAASILAREAFLYGLEKLSKDFNTPFPKGSSKNSVVIGRKFVAQYGKERLDEVCKIHFKTSKELSE